MTTNDVNPLRDLTCSCCGEPTTGRQWHNRDTGFGLCNNCIDFCKSRSENMERSYGQRGVHYDVPEMTEAERNLRALWTRKGITMDRQNELLAEIAEKAAPGAKIGPFTLPSN